MLRGRRHAHAATLAPVGALSGVEPVRADEVTELTQERLLLDAAPIHGNVRSRPELADACLTPGLGALCRIVSTQIPRDPKRLSWSGLSSSSHGLGVTHAIARSFSRKLMMVAAPP